MSLFGNYGIFGSDPSHTRPDGQSTAPLPIGVLELQAYRAGTLGQSVPTPTRRELASWFDGFSLACAAARAGVRV